jgi:AmmeMemoRadiSam system protein B
MKKKYFIPLIAAATLVVAALGMAILRTSPSPNFVPIDTKFGTGESGKSDEKAPSIDSPVLRPIDAMAFVSPRVLDSTVSVKEKVFQGKPVAGVVNHHLLAPDLVARFWKSLKAARPDIDRIIILSPDHFSAGRGDISITDRPYATPFGPMETDATFVKSILGQGATTLEDGSLFEYEHGVGALVPFAKREFPEAKIIPIAMRNTLNGIAALEFGKTLARSADDKTVLVVSSDMSHYLTEAQALKNDATTLQRLQDLKPEFFRQGSDDFLDNRVGMLALSGFLQEKKIQSSFQLMDHSISSRYGGLPAYTTSYITGTWVK